MTGGIEWLGEEQSGLRMQHFKGTLILTKHIMDSFGSHPMSNLGMPHLWIDLSKDYKGICTTTNNQ